MPGRGKGNRPPFSKVPGVFRRAPRSRGLVGGDTTPASTEFGSLQITLVRTPRVPRFYSTLGPPQVVTPIASDPVATGPIGALALPIPPQARNTNSKLSPPATLAAPPTPSLRTTLAKNGRGLPRRTRSFLSPPAVVDTPAIPPAPKIRTTLVPQRHRVKTISVLGGPTVVTIPDPLETTVRTTLAPQPRQGRQSKYKLSPPTVVTVAATPPPETVLRVTLAPQPTQGRLAGYSLGAPTIVDIPPAAVLRVTLAQQKLNRRKTISRLGEPTVLNTPVAGTVPAPIKVYLAEYIRQARIAQQSKVRVPVVVGAAVVPPEPPVEEEEAWSAFRDTGWGRQDHGKQIW